MGQLDIPGLFFFIFFFSKQLTVNIQCKYFADDWIRTVDLWSRKRPLYQLSHIVEKAKKNDL